jgi:uncharacterized protein
MPQTHKFFPLLTGVLAFCFCLAMAQQAQARTGAEIAKIFNSGLAAYDAGDYQQAFKIWWDLQYEDLAAMRNLAMMLRVGQGVAKNPQKAEEIYQRAAEAGLPTAQADLADMLLKGEAGPPNLPSALPLLEAAAAANHPIAQFELAQLYETGAPPLLQQNLEVARQLYAAAASHGMKEAADRLRIVAPAADAAKKSASDATAQTSAATPPKP